MTPRGTEQQCYAEGCTETFESPQAVERHMRDTRDAVHDPTRAFREESRV